MANRYSFAALALAVTLSGDAAEGQQSDPDAEQELLSIRRVYVDRLSGGETAVHIRDMIISSLQRARLFALTENPERADVVMRGSAEDLVFTDTFQSSDGVNARISGGVNTSDPSAGRAANRRGIYGSVGAGQQESMRIAERKHEAVAAVRLVNKSGDIIWSTTQESLGGKFRGAGADVADKITKQLVEDYERVRKKTSASPAERP